MQPSNNNGRSRRLNLEFSMPLPRFHPAVYQSPSSSNSTSAVTSPRNLRTPSSIKTPSSPRQQPLRQHNEATRKLIEYQQEIMRASGAAGHGTLPVNVPGTPSLVPCGSPGPATPLNLEDQSGDYLTAGAARRGTHTESASQRDVVERMIRMEQERRQSHQTGPSSPPVSPSTTS